MVPDAYQEGALSPTHWSTGGSAIVRLSSPRGPVAAALLSAFSAPQAQATTQLAGAYDALAAVELTGCDC